MSATEVAVHSQVRRWRPLWLLATAFLMTVVDGDIVIYASYQLGRTLIEHHLVHELRLFVFPAVAGDGERLFGQTSDKKPLRLLGTRTVGDSLVFLTYEIARDA